ncbi:MAG: hypothetical protein ICV59_04405 [Thermoleophilia bacterium]|nr:hypothetical protein [Thermoleophilia bacterium]
MAVDREAGRLPKVAFAAGVLAALAFFALGFIFEDWWFVVGLVLGAAAVVAGWLGRQRSSGSERTLATIGLVLGAIVVVWFATYMIVSTIF